MKISLNTIKQFNERYGCSDDVTAIGVEALVQKINAQLGGVEETIDLGATYQGIVIVKVVSCEKHPNADKLNVCMVDDGGVVTDVDRNERGLVQVVCGAPNVRAGLTVAWLPPGSTVPETVGKEPFVLSARELRGIVSNGMLASPRELALGDSHEGILEIDEDLTPGSDFAEVFGLKDDIVLDIENKMFTHRPDCFGWLGVSRELAGIQDLPFKSPAWYTADAEIPAVEGEALPLQISNELPELVPRFMAVVLRDVHVGPSPVWLQVELSKAGVRSINNIVDYTNYFMLLTGQPLHAYDYDKIKSISGEVPTIVVRNPHSDEKILLLNGKEVVPRSEAIMIATDKQAIGIGGVMGGGDTEVDESTRHIVLECATFDMYSVRRTSMAHGLFTDAVTRFNKGQSPLQNQAVLARITAEIRQFAGGKVASDVIDDNRLPESIQARQSLHPPIVVTADFITQRLGVELSAEQMQRLLQNVEFHVEVQDATLTVTAPFWRTDIELREDIVEEVGRLHGFDALQLALPKRTLNPTPKDPMLTLKALLREQLATVGANEVLTYSFVHGDLLRKVGQQPEQAYQISNALSPDLQYYRLSLTPSLLEKVHLNQKAGYDNFALFELGKVHQVDYLHDGVPTEFERVALVLAANKKAAEAYAGAPYYQARHYVQHVLAALHLINKVSFEPLDPNDPDVATSYYEPGRAATIRLGETVIGRVGEYKASVRKALKLPHFCAGFELGLTPLLSAAAAQEYTTLSRFPKVTQDITLKVTADVPYQTLAAALQTAISEVEPPQSLSTLQPLAIYQAESDTDHKQITFRLSIANYERTLTDQAVNTLLDAVAVSVQQSLGAQRI